MKGEILFLFVIGVVVHQGNCKTPGCTPPPRVVEGCNSVYVDRPDCGQETLSEVKPYFIVLKQELCQGNLQKPIINWFVQQKQVIMAPIPSCQNTLNCTISPAILTSNDGAEVKIDVVFPPANNSNFLFVHLTVKYGRPSANESKTLARQKRESVGKQAAKLKSEAEREKKQMYRIKHDADKTKRAAEMTRSELERTIQIAKEAIDEEERRNGTKRALNDAKKKHCQLKKRLRLLLSKNTSYLTPHNKPKFKPKTTAAVTKSHDISVEKLENDLKNTEKSLDKELKTIEDKEAYDENEEHYDYEEHGKHEGDEHKDYGEHEAYDEHGDYDEHEHYDEHEDYDKHEHGEHEHYDEHEDYHEHGEDSIAHGEDYHGHGEDYHGHGEDYHGHEDYHEQYDYK